MATTKDSDTLYDLIIIGLGAYGSSALYYAGEMGLNVLGLEQFSSPHNLGSSHGESRITRTAYFEDPAYVKIAQEGQRLFEDLERASGDKLFLKVGGVYGGPRGCSLMRGVEASVRTHALTHTQMTGKDLNAQYKAFSVPDDWDVIYEKDAGVLLPEKCIDAYIRLARARKNVSVHFNARVLDFGEECGTGQNAVKVVSDVGIFRAKKVVVSAGMWMARTLKALGADVRIQRNQLVWFASRDPKALGTDNLPIFICETPENIAFYGFPDLGTGFKVSIHCRGELYDDAERVQRGDDDKLIADVLRYVPPYMRALAGVNASHIVRSGTCFYTVLPDEDFLLDFHPQSKNIVLVSCCSGHGYKFSSVLGRDAVQMALNGERKYGRFNF